MSREETRAAEPKLARAAGLVGLLTLLSRIFGLIRDGIIAAFFDKRGTDAFFIAFRIPNVLRRLLAEGTLTIAFIPVFTDYHGGNEARARRMLQNMLGTTLVVLLLVTVLGILLAPWLVPLFAYGFVDDPPLLALSIFLLRLMFAFLITVGLTALAMGALNTVRHFTAPALAPVLLNVGIILTVIVASGQMARFSLDPVTALAMGVLLGGTAQLLFQIPFLARYQLLVAPRFNMSDPGVVKVATLMLPSVFGLAIYELNVIVGGQFASLLHDGAISVLYYAQRLLEFPIGVFAVSVATVTMPELSQRASNGEHEALKETYRFALRVVFFVLLPATAGLLALGRPLVSVLFQRGAFTEAMASETALALVGYALALCAAGGVRQTVPVFYALKDTRTPVKIAAVAFVFYTATAGLLYQPLETFGLALSVAVSANVNFALLVWALRRRVGPLGLLSAVRPTVIKATLAAVACGLAAHTVARLGDWGRGGLHAGPILVLIAAVGTGALTFTLAAWILRCPELGKLYRTLR